MRTKKLVNTLKPQLTGTNFGISSYKEKDIDSEEHMNKSTNIIRRCRKDYHSKILDNKK